MAEVRTLYVDAGEDGVRLDRWFRRRWPHLSHIQINKLARTGQIRVDGARAKAETRLSAGAQVRVPPLPEAPPKGEGNDLSDRDRAFVRGLVLYEDDEVLALNKPAGLAVQGGTKTSRHVDRLLGAWGEGTERPRLVHRLDRDTSGVLVLGKSPAAAARLAGAFARRRAQKTYWAIVSGVPKPGEGLIDLPLAKQGFGDREMVAPADPKDPQAEPAQTEFVTISRAAQTATWLALKPITGRTHQLRAHMLAVGYAILGDPKYHDERSVGLSGDLKLQLHARRIVLPHPGGGELALEAPISPEMRAGFERFGFEEHEAPADPFGGGRRP
ncbi:MAG TPA: RluA family pseudouridine synthase [Caulobacteraceae bacterium]|jgi:23S rRNA pseudouridine955/2504/2580 synthase|nr:RluA family pseudouridine synthase [Caulobacteraceae bacterium]